MRDALLNPRYLLLLGGALITGFVCSIAARELIPMRPSSPPLAAIAVTTFLLLLHQAATLSFLGAGTTASIAWLKSVLLCAVALAGVLVLGLASPRMLLIVWALCACYAGLLCAAWALLSLLTQRRTVALQCVLLLAVLANSALFWSRGPITAYSRSESLGAMLPDAVMKLSPPLALSGAFHQEAETQSSREGARFDIIRAPLTYDVWIGSYQAVPYPEVLPQKATLAQRFQPGMILSLGLWFLPVLLLCGWLQNKKINPAESRV